MSVVKLTNPVDAIANSIADPLEQAAKEFKQLRDLHDTANQHLKQDAHDLEVTLGKDIAQPFADMIRKQYNFADGIDQAIGQIADFYNEAAQAIRTAAHWLEPVLTPCFDLIQWAVDQLTADIVVRQGQSAVQAIFDDLRRQVNRAESDAGNFFGDLFHLNFSAALHDATDEASALLHMAGDALAMIAQVEPLLCQWAEDIFQAVNWCCNEVNSVLYGIVDWVFGLSDIVSDITVFADPNSTDAEKWIAGADIGLNVIMDVAMFTGAGAEIRGGDLVFKFLGKDFVKEIENQILKKFLQALEKATLKELREKLLQKVASLFKPSIDKLFLAIAAGDISKQTATDILRRIVGTKTIPAIAITDPARKAIYDQLVQKFPEVDANFIAHLVDANPGKTPLSEKQIEDFLTQAKNQGELDYITKLYTYVYKSDRPGLDQLLRDIANGSDTNYKGSLYQLEWIAAHNKDVRAVEVLDKAGQHGIDAILNDGTYVDFKAYSGKVKPIDMERQIDRYLRDFPDIKNHSLEFVFQSGVNGIDQAAIDKIKQRIINYGSSHGLKVDIKLWP